MAGSVRIDDREDEIGIRLPTGLNELRDEGLLADVRGEGAVWGLACPKESAWSPPATHCWPRASSSAPFLRTTSRSVRPSSLPMIS